MRKELLEPAKFGVFKPHGYAHALGFSSFGEYLSTTMQGGEHVSTLVRDIHLHCRNQGSQSIAYPQEQLRDSFACHCRDRYRPRRIGS